MPKCYLYVFALFFIGCKGFEAETKGNQELGKIYGLNGEVYSTPSFSKEKKDELELNLADAKAIFENDPSEDNYIWYARRLAYLYRFDEAMDVFAKGLEVYPRSFKLLRHRGHRYISIRQLDKAIDDLSKAAALAQGESLEIEPDGIPNKLNIPLSNYHFNIYYHLGLAYFLKGDYSNAANAYDQCMIFSDNNDLKIATADWMYMTKQRLNQMEDAQKFINTIDDELEVIENDSYLQRIKLYKGKVDVNDVLNVDAADADLELKLATQGYGVANWYLVQKDTVKAVAILTEILKSSSVTAFGFIAAEADLNRLNK
ncbi:MAG TPA: hypothetical protein PKD85_10590 [Saprospiraceae bacterium]|nr:hypothetical protein [Saprospiraceae bacterium]